MKHLIPEEALKKHIAILGMNGSGKTSVAKSQVIEPALKAGARVCNIDPTGVGWGLRLGADGKSKGYAIYIVGGDHADFPLVRRDGKAWGEIVATSSDSFVFDTSQMTVEDRSQWFTDFAEVLLRKNKGPLNFVLDEAHLFAPQGGSKSGGVAPRMLHATNNLLALGRSRGLRITMISQRAAKLHKDALTQAHTLVAMMMTSPQDRNAVKDWIADQADAETGKEIIASLPSLAPGSGWVWAPREKVLELVKFHRPRTFDSSSAPDIAEGDGPVLMPINPEAVKGMLAKVAKDTVANDPAALRAEIARLKNEMAGLGIDQTEIQRGYERGFEAGKTAMVKEAKRIGQETIVSALVGMQRLVKEMEINFGNIIEPVVDGIDAAVKTAKIAFPDVRDNVKFESGQTAASLPAGAPRRATVASPARAKPPAVSGSGGSLSGPEQKIVDAIRWWNVMGVPTPTHAQVGFIAKYAHKSGTWARYLSTLRSAGMIEPRGDLLLTEAGLEAAAEPDAPPTREALWTAILEQLDGPQQSILKPIIAAYPDGMSHADAAAAAGYQPATGTWARYLSKLRSRELIEKKGDLKAQGWMFP